MKKRRGEDSLRVEWRSEEGSGRKEAGWKVNKENMRGEGLQDGKKQSKKERYEG